MFEVHLVCPHQQTDRVIGLLSTDSGVGNIVVVPAGARQPAGDVIQFNLANGSANLVLGRLRALGLGERAPLTILSVAAAVPDRTGTQEMRRRHLGESVPFWELVYAEIRAGAVYAPSFFVLLVIAGLIAAVGILTNSQILIVGAMVVGPEYGAILSVAAGIDSRHWHPVRSGLIALTGGFLAAMALTFVFAWCVRGLGETPQAYSLGLRPVSSLINTPNLFSVVVAILAGIVGVVALAEARTSALIGVFISVTTIPAAADVGVSLAYRSWSEAGGSALQLLLNVVLLIVVGALMLSLIKGLWRKVDQRPGVG